MSSFRSPATAPPTREPPGRRGLNRDLSISGGPSGFAVCSVATLSLEVAHSTMYIIPILYSVLCTPHGAMLDDQLLFFPLFSGYSREAIEDFIILFQHLPLHQPTGLVKGVV